MFRTYEKYATFLRLEALSNNLKDFGLRKSLDNLPVIRKTLAAVTDRFAGFEAEALNVHVDFSLFQRLALPVVVGRTKVPGIKIQDTRMIRLMEVLLHAGTKIEQRERGSERVYGRRSERSERGRPTVVGRGDKPSWFQRITK